MNPEEVIKMLIKWYHNPCYKEDTKAKCNNTCPLWYECEALSDLVEKWEEESNEGN